MQYKPNGRRSFFIILHRAESRKMLAQIFSRIRRRDCRDLLGSAACNERSAAVSPLGTEVDQIVGGLYHFHIVLDHKHGVARVYEALKHREQARNVFGVQSRGRLIKNIYSLSRAAARQLGRKLYALRLAARYRR